MSDQITAVAELDALPVRTLAENAQQSLIRKEANGSWQTLGSGGSFWWESQDIALSGPWTVLYRPGAPARTEPTEAGLVALFREHHFDRLVCYDHESGSCDPAGCHDLRITQEEHYARLVLALLPQRVAPSASDLLPELDARYGLTRTQATLLAESIAAVFGSQPTVAEVRAQALKDAADAMCAIFMSGRTLGTASDLWLRARAARGEA